MAYSKVEGHPHLVRDDNTKAIINISNDQFVQAKRLKEQMKKKQSQIENLEERINSLEEKLYQALYHLEKK